MSAVRDLWWEDDIPSASDLVAEWGDRMTSGELMQLGRRSRADVARWSRPDEAA